MSHSPEDSSLTDSNTYQSEAPSQDNETTATDSSAVQAFIDALRPDVVLPVAEALGVRRELMGTVIGSFAAAEGFNKRQRKLREDSARLAETSDE